MDADGGRGKDRRREVCRIREDGGGKSSRKQPKRHTLSFVLHLPVPLSLPSHSCCVTERRETHFLFCLSRNVGRPDRLAFHWPCTAERSPCGSFTQSLLCVSMCLCVFLLHYLCYQPTRPHTGRQGAGKRKPESARRAHAVLQGNAQIKYLAQQKLKKLMKETYCPIQYIFGSNMPSRKGKTEANYVSISFWSSRYQKGLQFLLQLLTWPMGFYTVSQL